MAVQAVAAIIAATAAVVTTSVGIAAQVKASKESEKMRKLQKKRIQSEQAATDLQRIKTADMAGQGGLTAGQYGRSLMQDDIYGMQVEGLTNKMESQSVFGDAFRKEAFAKLALSDIKQFTQKTSQNLQDMDSAAIIRNAELSVKAASDLRKSESEINRALLETELMELEQKRVMMENVSKGIASTAALVGATVKYAGMQDKGTTTAMQDKGTTTAKSTGIAGALDTKYNGRSPFDPAPGVSQPSSLVRANGIESYPYASPSTAEPQKPASFYDTVMSATTDEELDSAIFMALY